MRIAYLILAHHQPKHLAKLIRVLDSPGCSFFIHIDAKVDQAAFREVIPDKSNITFLDQRVPVRWGAFSQVAATLSLLSAATAALPSFDRFCLLSGSDFPIKSNSQIRSEFNTSREFLRIDRKLDLSQPGTHTKNIAFHWFMDGAPAALTAMSGRLIRQTHARTPLYHGSQWWSLTRDCVDYILHFVAADAGYLGFFKTVFCPDEIFFHSIVKNSPFGPRITHDFERAASPTEHLDANEHGCHYIEWEAIWHMHPKTLDLRDCDELLRSKCLFARKFSAEQSAGLVARLEDLLAAGNGAPSEREPSRRVSL